MKLIHSALALLPALIFSVSANAERRLYLPMEVESGQVSELVSGMKFDVATANTVETLPGVKGDALRLDGYSNFIKATTEIGDLSSFTFSLWCAMETWPIIEHDIQNETDMACIAGNYDPAAKSGFGFFVSRTGKFAFKFYSGGWPGEIVAPEPLPLYQWNNLVAASDGSKVSLYNNGQLLGSTNCKKVSLSGDFMVGKSSSGRSLGPFALSAVNGLIDEIEIFDEAIPAAQFQNVKPENEPLLSVASADKFSDDILRPVFHGMPSRNWTNEPHGLIYYNQKYHIFFQKNANGPYMSRLQWGHIVSDNLYDWEEMPIAIGSDKWYDLKGCWSGCIALDDEVTGGKPNIIYTGVDYARAMIVQAAPADDDLLKWTKRVNPIIDGRPSGLSDDFRDPYFFRSGSDAYIAVGTSKAGKGACTLHKYNPSNNSWSNDGKIFFSTASAAGEGTFWEMPSITPIGDKHLFCVTPQGINTGVKAIYWTGSINPDGTFNPSGESAPIELPGFAKDGYGLLSPSVTTVDGKTIAVGIVPDKLRSERNYDLGWAHTYSLPREWSLDAAGKLVQKPYSGLKDMRVEESKVALNEALHGEKEIFSEGLRCSEIEGEFTVGDAEFGFTLFKKDNEGLQLYYTPATGILTIDMRSLPRLKNDESSFNGLYQTALPEGISKGSKMKIHLFIDHSIMDIFINDRWASSIRVFPTDAEADKAEVFSQGGTTAVAVNAWKLRKKSSGIENIFTSGSDSEDSAYVDVYDLSGRLLKRNTHISSVADGLTPGIKIIGNKKVLIP